MADKVYNFGAGPAMLPVPVMEQIRDEFLDYHGMGVSVIEISHRSQEFGEILAEAKRLFRELANVPENYRILFLHGGARMQFSALPMNLAGRTSSKKCLYIESGNFAGLAIKDAAPYGDIRVIASSASSNFDRLPTVSLAAIEQDASYLHLTSNNTLFGTQWPDFPKTGSVPLIADQTSEILSRKIDYSRFGMIYAGLQKNLGPSGMAVAVIRDDLLGFASDQTPLLLNYATCAKDDSLTNTTNTFAIYVVKLVLQWLKNEGGVTAIEARNRAKAAQLYAQIDSSGFYLGFAQPDSRSLMNVTFNLPSADLEKKFLDEALARGLYGLPGHRSVGGVRASIYNPMPLAGVEKLIAFMREFEQRNG
ncbi:MAG: 3-phosphoserine/phosphohydroxythreonine transaminase [Desulfuromonadales bacterium]|nr:3-phosphoserine/phosphohydroxythreonine transaminase [Desulfuromonadales bacterium]